MPQFQLRRAGCEASLCVCVLTQETQEGLAALLSSLHTPAAAGAPGPAPYCWGEAGWV